MNHAPHSQTGRDSCVSHVGHICHICDTEYVLRRNTDFFSVYDLPCIIHRRLNQEKIGNQMNLSPIFTFTTIIVLSFPDTAVAVVWNLPSFISTSL